VSRRLRVTLILRGRELPLPTMLPGRSGALTAAEPQGRRVLVSLLTEAGEGMLIVVEPGQEVLYAQGRYRQVAGPGLVERILQEPGERYERDVVTNDGTGRLRLVLEGEADEA
jgi:hypothetical protein